MKNWTSDQSALFWGHVYDKIVQLKDLIQALRVEYEKLNSVR